MRRKVVVKVPATSGNLGPGFDCLGMALDWWNEVALEVGRPGISIGGEGAESLSHGEDNLVYRAVSTLFREVGTPIPGLSISCKNTIPLYRGLGSSAAAIVGGMVAANVLLEEPLSKERILSLAASLEGHADNVAPALLGGCCIVVQEKGGWVTASIPIPKGLKAVLVIPEKPMPTHQARAVLPEQVCLADAVYNISRVALLVASLSLGELEHLAVATQDRLHQPYRQRLLPAMKQIFQAALDAGALGVFLSGGGSSILALTRGRELTVGYEMINMAKKMGLKSELKITRPVEKGAYVVAVE